MKVGGYWQSRVIQEYVSIIGIPPALSNFEVPKKVCFDVNLMMFIGSRVNEK